MVLIKKIARFANKEKKMKNICFTENLRIISLFYISISSGREIIINIRDKDTQQKKRVHVCNWIFFIIH